MILGIFLRRHFLDLDSRVENAEYQDERANIERPYYRVRNDAFRGDIADADSGEHKGECKTHYGPCIAQERLNAVGLGLLFFVDHVANQHLERLHGHIDAGVKEH